MRFIARSRITRRWRAPSAASTADGIVIPGTAVEKPSIGEGVYARPGKTDDNGKITAMGSPFAKTSATEG